MPPGDPSEGPTTEPTVPQVHFVQLSVPAMTALQSGDLEAGRRLTGLDLSEYFVADQARRLWHRRLAQMARDPEAAHWIARAVVANGQVVGFAGFHGPPDARGMVEIGYSVAPEARRRGYARATLAALLTRARAEAGVNIVRVTISPDNAASLATIAGFGFEHLGEQMDEEDGLELIFEVAP